MERKATPKRKKGEASDAFKRAAFNFGIGRELYTRIFIWLSVPTVESGQARPEESQDMNCKTDLPNFMYLTSIPDNERELIEELQISDSNGNVVFTPKAQKRK